MRAISSSNIDEVAFLLSNGADPNAFPPLVNVTHC